MAKRRKTRGTYGKGSVYENAPGRWAVMWREGGKRRRKYGFASREEAERVRNKILLDISLGRSGLPPDPGGVPTLAELAAPWLERRKLTHRAGAEDKGRWNNHLAPEFGHLRPHEVDQGRIRRFVEAKLAKDSNPATIRGYVALLSSLYVELVEDGIAQSNPCRGLPRATRKLVKSTHDPRTVPFIERAEDIRSVFLALREPLNVAFAIGVMGGLRTGEIFALRWEHVDLAGRRIHVRESVKGQTKDKDSRVVPIQASLLPVLESWKIKSGGKGLVIPPLRSDGGKIDKHTPGNYLRPVLRGLGLIKLSEYREAWYASTRHTFASQWVIAGGSIEKLSLVLGHYSVVMTEKYAHLRPDLFRAKDLDLIGVDFAPATGEVIELSSTGQGRANGADLVISEASHG